MNGRPVWLASASLRDSFGRVIPSARWTASDRALLERTLLDVLDGVGDDQRERFFRMPVTACMHRQLSADEETGLPAWWADLPAVHTAGGPMEILRETVPSALSTRPCANPTRRPVSVTTDPDVFLLNDCGVCETCAARLQAEDYARP